MLTDTQIRRYARHIVLREVGGLGQAKLLAAKVLVIGAGGLGAPVLLYLAAAGIGTLGVVDDDTVDLSNLQRQIIHSQDRLGQPKTDSAAEAIAGIDPDIHVIRHPTRLTAENAAPLIADYDLVIDGSDNFAARFAAATACYHLGKPLISAAIFQFHGQVTSLIGRPGNDKPCLRCLHPEEPPAEAVPSCAQAGVLGMIAGVIGSLQATEAVKLILGQGAPLIGRLLKYEALDAAFYEIRYAKRPDCPLCGKSA